MGAVFAGTRKWVYPQSVKGRYQRLHRLTGRLLLAFLVIVPWITWNGHPAVQADIADRRAYVLGHIYTAADGYLIVLGGLFAAFTLFFVTSLYGRVWCGYACPQTVFLEELVRPLERLVEGDRGVRMQRDQGPWTVDRAWRKGAKWGLFALVAFLVSMSFVSWFAGARALWTGAGGATEYTFVAAFTAVGFFDFAWFREQLCNYVCPYARFQGALADDESQVVSYDVARGEPRAKGKASGQAGHCVDCNKCVTVCPQGIDIREGYQLECITCGRCIDACEGVMEKFEQKGLIRYSTVAEEQGRKARLLRPRTVLYATLLSAIALGMTALVAVHQPLEVQVDRVPGSLFEVDPDGMVRNTWLLHVVNNDPGHPVAHYTVQVDGLDGAEVTVPELALGPTEDRRVPLVVRIPPEAATARTIPLVVKVTSEGGSVAVPATFKTPHGS